MAFVRALEILYKTKGFPVIQKPIADLFLYSIETPTFYAILQMIIHSVNCISILKIADKMSHSDITPSTTDDGWMYKEATEKTLVIANICGSYDYARQKMATVRKALNLKRITVKTFADFYQCDVLLFRNLK